MDQNRLGWPWIFLHWVLWLFARSLSWGNKLIGLCYLYIHLLASVLIFKPFDEFWTNLSDQHFLPSYKFCGNEQLNKCYKLMVPVKENLQYWFKYNSWHWRIQERPVVIDLRSSENSHLIKHWVTQRQGSFLKQNSFPQSCCSSPTA